MADQITLDAGRCIMGLRRQADTMAIHLAGAIVTEDNAVARSEIDTCLTIDLAARPQAREAKRLIGEVTGDEDRRALLEILNPTLMVLEALSQAAQAADRDLASNKAPAAQSAESIN